MIWTGSDLQLYQIYCLLHHQVTSLIALASWAAVILLTKSQAHGFHDPLKIIWKKDVIYSKII